MEFHHSVIKHVFYIYILLFFSLQLSFFPSYVVPQVFNPKNLYHSVPRTQNTILLATLLDCTKTSRIQFIVHLLIGWKIHYRNIPASAFAMNTMLKYDTTTNQPIVTETIVAWGGVSTDFSVCKGNGF